MKFRIDHDMHMHSRLSPCSSDQNQTPENLLRFAEAQGLSTICLTDHFWDENVPASMPKPDYWYAHQTTEKLSRWGKLPQGEGIRFLFGCETDISKDGAIGISPANFDRFDFIIVPVNHLHLTGFTCEGGEDSETRAKLWCDRLELVLDAAMPFHKMGLAHLTGTADVFPCISDEELTRLFTKAASRGIGIELNGSWLNYTEEEFAVHLRPLRIAKACGCRFYLGSDAHSLDRFERRIENFTKIINALDLEESDKFILK